jgi:hypothetical protein
MESVIYDSAASVQQLLDRGFEIPIHFAALGTNGSVFAGTFVPSPDGQGLDCQITIQPDSDEGLTGPVNIMYGSRLPLWPPLLTCRFRGPCPLVRFE